MLSGLDLETVHLGLVWEAVRDKYPVVEQQPPVDDEVEHFDNLAQATVELKFRSSPTVPRLWLMERSKTNLVQVQSNRIGFNWRKQRDGDAYPRFPHVRDSFEEAYDRVLEAASSAGHRAKPTAFQCEVVYVNEVPAATADGTSHGDPDPVLRMWAPLHSELPGPSEDVRLATRHRLPPDVRTNGSRLMIALEPVVRLDTQVPVYLLTLTVRGAPPDGSLDGILAFLDMGHEIIVRAFASLTTTEMHNQWERIE